MAVVCGWCVGGWCGWCGCVGGGGGGGAWLQRKRRLGVDWRQIRRVERVRLVARAAAYPTDTTPTVNHAPTGRGGAATRCCFGAGGATSPSDPTPTGTSCMPSMSSVPRMRRARSYAGARVATIPRRSTCSRAQGVRRRATGGRGVGLPLFGQSARDQVAHHHDRHLVVQVLKGGSLAVCGQGKRGGSEQRGGWLDATAERWWPTAAPMLLPPPSGCIQRALARAGPRWRATLLASVGHHDERNTARACRGAPGAPRA